jgi:hypothetical protein
MWCLHLQAREIIEVTIISMSIEYMLNCPIYIHWINDCKIVVIDALIEFYVKKGWINMLHCWQIFG